MPDDTLPDLPGLDSLLKRYNHPLLGNFVERLRLEFQPDISLDLLECVLETLAGNEYCAVDPYVRWDDGDQSPVNGKEAETLLKYVGKLIDSTIMFSLRREHITD